MTLALDTTTSIGSSSNAESDDTLFGLARRYQTALRSIHAGTASLSSDTGAGTSAERRLRDILCGRDDSIHEERKDEVGQELRRIALAASLLLQVMTSVPSDARSAMSILSTALSQDSSSASSPSSPSRVSSTPRAATADSPTLTMTHVFVALMSLRSRLSPPASSSPRTCNRVCDFLEANITSLPVALQEVLQLTSSSGGTTLEPHRPSQVNVLGKRQRGDAEEEDTHDAEPQHTSPSPPQLGLYCAAVLGVKGLREQGQDTQSAEAASAPLLQQCIRSALSETCKVLFESLASHDNATSALAVALERASRAQSSTQAVVGAATAGKDVLAWLPPLPSMPSAEGQARHDRAQITVLLNTLTSTHLDWDSKMQSALLHLSACTAIPSSSPDLTHQAFYERLFDGCFEAVEDCAGHDAKAQQLQLWETTQSGVIPHIICELTHLIRRGAPDHDESVVSALRRSCTKYLERSPAASPAPDSTEQGRPDRSARGQTIATFIWSFEDLHLISPDQATSLLPVTRSSGGRPARLMQELIAQSTEKGLSIETLIAQEYLSDSIRTSNLLRLMSEQPEAAVVAKFCGSAIIDILRRVTAVSSPALDGLALICSALTEEPKCLQAITAFHPAVRLVEPLLAVFESDEVLDHLCGPGAGADDEPAMLSRVLLCTHWLVKLAPGTQLASTAGSNSQPSPIARRHLFFATSSEAFHLAQLNQEVEAPLISRWISELFDSDGIGDELIRDSPPRLLIKLAATLFDQAVTAAELGVIDVEMLRNGLSFFLQDLLSYTLPGVLTWIIQDIRRVEPWEGRTIAANGSNGEGTSSTVAATQVRNRSNSSSKAPESRPATDAPNASRGALLLSVLSMLVLDESCPALAIELASDPFRLLLRDGVLSHLLSPSAQSETSATAGSDATAGNRTTLPGVDSGTVEALKAKFEAIEKRGFVPLAPIAWMPRLPLTPPSHAHGAQALQGGNGAATSAALTPQAAGMQNREGAEGEVDQMSKLEDMALFHALLAGLQSSVPAALTGTSIPTSPTRVGSGVGASPEAQGRINLRRCLRPIVKRLAELKQNQRQRQPPRRGRQNIADEELETWIGLTASVLGAHLMQSASHSRTVLQPAASAQMTGTGMDLDIATNATHQSHQHRSVGADPDPAQLLSELVYLLDLGLGSGSSDGPGASTSVGQAAEPNMKQEDTALLLLRTRTLLAARVLALFSHLPQYVLAERIRVGEGGTSVHGGQGQGAGASVGLGLGLGLGGDLGAGAAVEDLVMATRSSAEEDDLFGAEDEPDPEPELALAAASEDVSGKTSANSKVDQQASDSSTARSRARARARALLARLRSQRREDVGLPDLMYALIVHVFRVCTAAAGPKKTNLRQRLQALSMEIVGAFPATTVLSQPEAHGSEADATGGESLRDGDVPLRDVAEAVLEEVWAIMLGV